jgi:thiamine biosynthesis lipoprotein
MRALLLVTAMLAPTLAAAAPATEVHYVMGTYLRITAYGPDPVPAMRRCFADARRLEGVFSRFDPSSELSRVNAGTTRDIGPDFARLLERANALRAATGGRFDVTVGRLTALWRDAVTRPAAAALTDALAATGGPVAVVNGRLRMPIGTRLDFDGIAKGWAVDACVALLRGAGVRRALVSLGESSIYALGPPPGAARWTLDVRGVDPDALIGRLALRDQAMSVSSSLRADPRTGTRVGHIVDPRTGLVLRRPALGVVVAASATDAEAYSKALLLWGASGVEAVERLGALAVHVGPAGVRVGRRAARRRVFAPLAHPRRLPAAEEPLA